MRGVDRWSPRAGLLLVAVLGCSSSEDDGAGGASGTTGTGGADAAGGMSSSGGSGGAGGAAGASAGGVAGTAGSGAEPGAGGTASGGALPGSGSRPNVVFIMTDDLDSATLDQLLAAGLMPNLQSMIIDGGVTFRESFVTNSLCCPSRATFLSGEYSHNHGVYSNAGGYIAFLPHDMNTVAMRLHDAGYRTAHVGKYLNGYDDRFYVAPGWDEWHTTLDGSTYNIYEYEIIESIDGSPPSGRRPGTYQTDELALRASDFIRRSTEAPFFVAVLPLAPHVEVLPGQSFDNFREMYKLRIRPAERHRGSLRAPEGSGGYLEDQPVDPRFALPGESLPSFNEADLGDKPSWLRSGPNGDDGEWPLLDAEFLYDLRVMHLDRLESMLAVDDLLGSVFVALEERGIVDDTLVVFTSDNGFFMGEHRLNNKMFPYEEGLRVPLFVRPPGAATASIDSRIVLNNDLAPTICDYAGVLDGWNVDGRSLVPHLTGATIDRWRRRFLVEHWFLRVNSNGRLQYNDLPDYALVRTGADHPSFPNQVYVEYTRSASPPVYDRNNAVFEIEHYDLGTDPHQIDSVHADPAYDPARTQLQAELATLVACRGASCADAEDL